jgi:ATP-binding cassette subfamily C protein CydC
MKEARMKGSRIKGNALIRLRDLWRAHHMGWSLSYLLGAVTLICSVMLLAFSGWFISAAALAGIAAIHAGSFNYLQPGAVIRFFALTRTAGRYAERLQSHHTVLSLLKTLRLQSFSRLSQQSTLQLSLLVRPGSADLLQRLIADLDLLDQFPLRVLLPWGWAALAAVGYSFALWLLAPAVLPQVTCLLLLMLVLWPLLLQRFGIALAQQEVQVQSARREQLLNALQLLTTLLMFGRWSAQSQQLQQQDLRIEFLQRKLQWLQLGAQLGSQVWLLAGLLLIGILTTPLVLAESQLTSDTALHPAVWVALLLGWLGLAEVMAPLAQLQSALGYSLAARDRLNQIFLPEISAPEMRAPEKTMPEQTDSTSAAATHSAPQLHASTALPQILGLTLRQLQPGFLKPLPGLQLLNQQFQAGDCVLLQGPSGLGKSCLLQTLAGDLAAHHGEILLQDHALQELPLASLPSHIQHQLIGLLPQRPQLFQLTIAAELRLANQTASDAQLREVLTLTGLEQWLEKQPDGLATVLGQYGVGLSGGELRRFTLARLLLQKTPILLLDEPFAGLDQHSADQLLSRLAQWQQSGILIIASHQQLQHPAFNRHWVLAD